MIEFVYYRGALWKVLKIEEAGLEPIQPRYQLSRAHSRIWVFANEVELPDPDPDAIPF